MTPNTELLHKLFEFGGALSIITGAMAWWRKGSADEDELMSAAADTVLDTLADADTVTRIDTLTSRNLRDQISVEEAVEMDKERRLARALRRRSPSTASHGRRLRSARARLSWGVASRRMRAGS